MSALGIPCEHGEAWAVDLLLFAYIATCNCYKKWDNFGAFDFKLSSQQNSSFEPLTPSSKDLYYKYK